MIAAVKDNVPQPHIKRIIDLAGQGWRSVISNDLIQIGRGKDTSQYQARTVTTLFGVRMSLWKQSKPGKDWNLVWRTEKEKALAEGRDPKPCKTLPAQQLWDQIAYTGLGLC